MRVRLNQYLVNASFRNSMIKSTSSGIQVLDFATRYSIHPPENLRAQAQSRPKCSCISAHFEHIPKKTAFPRIKCVPLYECWVDNVSNVSWFPESAGMMLLLGLWLLDRETLQFHMEACLVAGFVQLDCTPTPCKKRFYNESPLHFQPKIWSLVPFQHSYLLSSSWLSLDLPIRFLHFSGITCMSSYCPTRWRVILRNISISRMADTNFSYSSRETTAAPLDLFA